MELELYASGHAVDNGRPTQRAGCAAVLLARDGDRVKYREISHHLESVTTPVAELQAAYMALMAVRPKMRQNQVSLWTASYPARALERVGDGWKIKANTHERLVDRLRVLASQFSQLQVVSRSNVNLTRAGELARVAARDQLQADTGTVDSLPNGG